MSTITTTQKKERTWEERQWARAKALRGASKRKDRSPEARLKSGLEYNDIYYQLTGNRWHITAETVMGEEDYVLIETPRPGRYTIEQLEVIGREASNNVSTFYRHWNREAMPRLVPNSWPAEKQRIAVPAGGDAARVPPEERTSGEAERLLNDDEWLERHALA